MSTMEIFSCRLGATKEASMKERFASMGICAVLAVLFLSSMPAPAPAEINVNLNIGPPPVVVSEPPEVVLIPGAGVYFVPDAGANIFFHAGFWWSPRGDRWYRSRVYNGQWVAVDRRAVPVEVIRVPSDYRVRYKQAKHIPYGQWKKEHSRKYEDNGRQGDRHDRKEHRKMNKRGHGHGD
jgi:hypothetical protein